MMQISVVVSICHALAGITSPVCHEEIAVQQEVAPVVVNGRVIMPPCTVPQPALADWKEKSKFRGDQWTIGRYKCVTGDYVLKDAI